MKIAILSGSPRINSVTRRVALHLENQLQQTTEHEVALIEMKDWTIPPVQSVWVSLDKTPVEFQPLAQKIFEADAYILVTPEYNGSYSPALKNLLDHFPKRHHKPFGIVTASPGAMGGIRASQQLLQLVPALFGSASPYMLIVPAVDNIDIPPHQPHLQTQNGLVCSVVGHDEFYCIAVSNPDETAAITHVPEFVHGKVTAKCFAQIRMKKPLISAGATTAEGNGIKNTIAFVCEEVEAITGHKL